MMKRGLLAVLFTALLSGFFMPGAWAQGSGASGTPPTGEPVTGVTLDRATVNASVTITAGNTFQTALNSNYGTSTPRQSLTIQNNNTNTDACWVFVGGGTASKAKAINLAIGQSYTRYWPLVPSDAIQVTCASTSDTVYIDYQ